VPSSSRLLMRCDSRPCVCLRIVRQKAYELLQSLAGFQHDLRLLVAQASRFVHVYRLFVSQASIASTQSLLMQSLIAKSNRILVPPAMNRGDSLAAWSNSAALK
jgi:hypothetical protein